MPFHEALRRTRIEKGLSQQQLAEAMNVDRSTVTKWETGDRLPNAATLARLSSVLGSNVGALLVTSDASDETPQVILVDDERIILTGGLPVLRSAMPGAAVTGFTVPAVIAAPIRTLGQCNTACSMMVVGMILTRVDPHSFKDPGVYWFTLHRLVLIPGLFWLLCRFLPIEPLVFKLSVLLTAMPAGATTSILAEKYGCDSEYGTKLVVISTLLSTPTVFLWTLILG